MGRKERKESVIRVVLVRWVYVFWVGVGRTERWFLFGFISFEG